MAAENETISLLSYASRVAKTLANPKTTGALLTALVSKGDAKKSIGLLLEERAAELPGHPAIRYEDVEWTWDEFNRRVNRVANYLRAQGIGNGDVVAINMQNRPEILVCVLATLKTGGIVAMINTSQTGDVLEHSLGLVSPKLMIVGEEQTENMTSVPELLDGALKGKLLHVADAGKHKLPKNYTDLSAACEKSSDANPATTPEVRLEQPCFYIFTSGTTGMPKASIMSHLRWYRSAHLIGKATMQMTPDDVFYCCLPFYHNNALTLGLGAVLTSGATLAISRKFSASKFWDECRQYGATTFCYIGELLRYLLNQPTQTNDRDHSVEKILGNGLRPDVWDEFKQRFGIERIHEFYGASEGNNGFINIFNYDKTCGWSSGGWKIVEYDIDEDEPVRDRKGRLKALGKGDTGLLVFEVSDRYPFDGYTNKEASEKKLFRNAFKKNDCWFNTGDLIKDLGFGHIQFVDRVGDTFRWQGENVATTEVEAVINHWLQTEDAVVYGVEVPGRDGRCGMVSYTVKSGETLDLEGLARHVQDNLPKYAFPRFMRVQQAQEITGTFKHQKAKLKKDGYDSEAIGDAVYFLQPGAASWVAMTAELKAGIDAGEIKL